jgi:hypothetical protein
MFYSYRHILMDFVPVLVVVVVNVVDVDEVL